uniref:Uncharacterized protein n=1 Tax=Anopheles culicifacies TaxID=139723 RepID=A0A182MAR4_9DIPT
MEHNHRDQNAVRVCTIVALVLPALVDGYVIRADDSVQERNGDASAFAGTDAETAWMVTGIIFIVLFVLAVIVCIYLWYLRNAKVKELRHLENIRAGKDHRNVWYGGNGGGGGGGGSNI